MVQVAATLDIGLLVDYITERQCFDYIKQLSASEVVQHFELLIFYMDFSPERKYLVNAHH